jgi:hypothetical protein
LDYLQNSWRFASSCLDPFASWIEQHAKDADEPFLLTQILNRLDLWVNDLQRFISWCRAEFGGNEKQEWVLGATREHCTDCLKYAGRIYRARSWMRVGALPQSRALECNKGPPPHPSGSYREYDYRRDAAAFRAEWERLLKEDAAIMEVARCSNPAIGLT